MNNISSKEKLQSIITQSINLAPQTTYESLRVYKKLFGPDDFFRHSAVTFSQGGPLVSLICLNCSDEDIDEFLSRQLYSNLEIVRTTADDSFADIIHYISSTESKYLCFYEPNHYYDSSKIYEMVYMYEQLSCIDIVIAARNYIDSNGTVIAPSDALYFSEEKNITLDGTLLLQYSINNNKNLFGNLSTLMVSTQYAKHVSFEMPETKLDFASTLSFLLHLLIGGRIHIMNTPLISTILQPYEDDTFFKTTYEELVSSLALKYGLTISLSKSQTPSPYLQQPLENEITFFYTDMGEYYNLAPIATEAAKRGYKTIFTQNITQKAEIGVYCQHVCYPENSKFSVILLHDLAQGHNRWPNIWYLEQWNNFDIGILPGKLWSSLWSQCACQFYANPRCGVYELGYPKSDLVNSISLETQAQKLRSQLNLKYDFSILYAPSWENDGKEDDFVRALSSLKVNLLIKQAHWPKENSTIIDNIKQMRALHENKYDNLYYIEPEESIFTALQLCDMVVSDESSVMIEAIIFHKPSIAVTDWLIPDTFPSRPASVPMDCVVKCRKAELRAYAEKLISNPSYYYSIVETGMPFFSNQGHVCEDIMNAIEYFTDKKTDCSFISKKITSKYATCSLWN